MRRPRRPRPRCIAAAGAAAARCRALPVAPSRASRTRRGGRGPAGTRTARARASADPPGPTSTSLRTSEARSCSSLRVTDRPRGRRPSAAERLAEHRGVLHQRALSAARPSRRAAISACSVSGTSSAPISPTTRYDGAVLDEQAAVEQHPHRLDRVERDPLGAREDLLRSVRRQPGHEPGEQLLHRRARQRLEVDGREVAVPGTPRRPPLRQLRPGERDDEDRLVARPLEQVLDEIEQARVRPLHVLEHEHDRVRRRPSARRTAATRRTAPAARPAPCSPSPSSCASRGSTNAPLVGIEDVLVERRPQLLARRSPAPRPRRSGSASAPCRRAPST